MAKRKRPKTRRGINKTAKRGGAKHSPARGSAGKRTANNKRKADWAEVSGQAPGVAVEAAIGDAMRKLPSLGRKYATLAGIQIVDNGGSGGGTTTHALLYVHLP